MQLDDDSKGDLKAFKPENLKATKGGVALSNGEGAKTEGPDEARDFSDVEWARVAELSNNPVLFDVIDSGDIDQGGLGDCWLLAAIAMISDYPGHLVRLFDQHEKMDDGLYTIRLFDPAGGWKQS